MGVCANSSKQSNEDGAEKESRPRSYVIADALLAVVAGSDTTALVLTCLFFSLMRNPDVYARLQAEVDKFYPPGENALDPRHLKDMPYLEAVMCVLPTVSKGDVYSPRLVETRR